MAKPLTPLTIRNLKAKPKRYEVPDGGCRGLRLVVHPSKRKSFVVRFRYCGVQKKLTLGSVLVERGVVETDTAPELDTPLSLAAARELATKALREARSGTDPCAAKQRQLQQERAAESDTLLAIASEYLRRESPRLRTVNQRKADFDLICASVLGRLPLGEIGRAQFVRVLDHIADQRGAARADRVLSALKTLLNWYATRSNYVPVLVRGGRRVSIAERARDRVLTDDELRAVWRAAEKDTGPFGRFVQFVLLTATRRSEAGGLRRSELDGNLWTIPGARYKNGKDTLIPLSAAAQKIISAMSDRGAFVFSASGAHALGDFGGRKALFDAACGVSGWRLHDLRRTSRTLLSRAGVLPDIAERCLGHAITGVRGVYDRFEFRDEKAAAFEKLAAQIDRIVHPPSGNVLPMTKGRRK